MRTTLALLITAAAVTAAPAAAHLGSTKLAHPTKSDLRNLALLASDYVEAEGLKYVGAVGVCKAEDRAVVKSGPGFRHVRCRMRTKNGYRFLVTWHLNKKNDWFVTVKRTL